MRAMTVEILLCKIANIATQSEDTDVGFVYNGKRYIPFEFFRTSCDLLEIVQSRKFTYREVDDGRSLALVYLKNARKVSTLEDEVMQTIFAKYQPNGELITKTDSADDEKLHTKYITTKLYNFIWQAHEVTRQNCSTNLKMPECFRPKLCRYQEWAVNWLLQHEKQVTRLPTFYEPLQAKDGSTTVYKHRYCMDLVKEEPASIELPPGGILADEMGLGKTVEVLALILLHPRLHMQTQPIWMELFDCSPVASKKAHFAETDKTVFCICGSTKRRNLVTCSNCNEMQHAACVAANPDSDVPYFCPLCWETLTSASPTTLVQSRATFIVMPQSIKKQWQTEIQQHVKPELRVLVYAGTAARKWIDPLQLADYDVVLSDYNIVRQEVYHTAEYISDRVRRNKPRFMRLPTPLLMVQWWRVCLDEAQMVESNTSKISAIVHMLPAVNRWAISGTPIQRSIDDLHSLLMFIGFEAVCSPTIAWNNLVMDFILQHENDDNKQRPLIDILQHCMYRNSKTKVNDELPIPPQTEKVHFIQLNNLELLFYREKHVKCQEKFDETVTKLIENADCMLTISPQIMTLILQPVLTLRQCCNIPVVSESKMHATNTQKQFLDPKELHSHLKSNNELECKSLLRSMASAYNGMAGIYFLYKNYSESIHMYKLTLKLARDYKETNYSVDSLLQIHALHNLMQAHKAASLNNTMELSEAQMIEFEQQCQALEYKYLQSYAAQLHTVKCTAQEALNNYDRFVNEKDYNINEFVFSLIDDLAQKEGGNYTEQLLDKLLTGTSIFLSSAWKDYIISIEGVLFVFQNWWKKVETALKELRNDFSSLQFFTDYVQTKQEMTSEVKSQIMSFTANVYDCHLSSLREAKRDSDKKSHEKRNSVPKRSLCKLCVMQDKLNNFECALFKKTIQKESKQTDGVDMPSAEMILAKSIMNFAKAHLSQKQTIDEHLSMLDVLPQLCKKWIKYWIEIEYTVKAYDELDMCKMRMSVTDDEEQQNNFRVAKYQLDELFVEQETRFQQAQHQFSLMLARLKYIMHLEKNVDPGACPICHSGDELRYAALECGHHVCLKCLKAMMNYKRNQKLSCAICRNVQSLKRIYYVTRVTKTPSNVVEVEGDYSSKIKYIVHVVLQLLRAPVDDVGSDPPKILIFSQWKPILQSISGALKANGIRHCERCTPRTIEEFKNPLLGVTCMLMTYANGSKGLNLTEANHVFLVEPILNPGEELQAIGRIHRFGQTKPTTVHRFIVEGTIEENIYKLVSNNTKSQENWDFGNTSLNDVRDLFKLNEAISEELH